MPIFKPLIRPLLEPLSTGTLGTYHWARRGTLGATHQATLRATVTAGTLGPSVGLGMPLLEPKLCLGSA